MPEGNEQFPVDWDYYLDHHVISRAQSLLEKAKTIIKFSKVKETKTNENLGACIQEVYKTLNLLYPSQTEQPKNVNLAHTETE